MRAAKAYPFRPLNLNSRTNINEQLEAILFQAARQSLSFVFHLHVACM
jgi:hypothetical protein